MTTITIREQSNNAQDEYQATVSFNKDEFPSTVKNPCSNQQELNLEWYFKEYSSYSDDENRAKSVVASIKECGQQLFKQLFCDRALRRYDREKHGIQCIEIIGSPAFHSLPWETLHDPEDLQPLALDIPIIRQYTSETKVLNVPPLPVINLLIVSARPYRENDINYRAISRPLVESLRQAKLRVNVTILRPGTYRALKDQLSTRQGYYHIIHLDVHGALFENKSVVYLESIEEEHNADPIEASQLAQLLVQHQIPITILNTCESGKQVGLAETSLSGKFMEAGMPLVLAMRYTVTERATTFFMKTLYQHLFGEGESDNQSSHDIATAIRYARKTLYNHKERRSSYNEPIELEEWIIPVVYQNTSTNLPLRDFREDEQAQRETYDARVFHQNPDQFIGRDLDILEIENKIAQRNILLIRGGTGIGKTTLLHHLAWWWQNTYAVDQVFYFGYDEKPWTHQQVLQIIAQALFGIEQSQGAVVNRLLKERHLLIFDALECINPSEQTALHEFLRSLYDGKSFILLGSQQEVKWLATGTFGDNVYELAGIDNTSANIFIKSTLKRHKVAYDDNYIRNLYLQLEKNPLLLKIAIQAILEKQTALLSALQPEMTGTDIQGKVKQQGILHAAINYIYNMLTPDEQGLLLCLAPLKSAINIDTLSEYSQRLQQYTVLAHLPFGNWEKVLEKMADWRLLRLYPNVLLQSAFADFLRSHLGEKVEWQGAIESVNSDSSEFGLWDEFCESIENFSSDYYYVLVVSNFSREIDHLEFIGVIDWIFVIDFDENSNFDGLFSKCGKKLEERKRIHKVVKNDSPTIHINHGCYWYFANGMVGRDDTLVTDKKQWRRVYPNDIEKQIGNLASAIGKSKPLKILCIVDNPDSDIVKKLRNVFQHIDGKFTDNFSSVVICSVQSVELDEEIVSEYDTKLFNFPLEQFLNGLSQFSSALSIKEGCTLPSRTGTPISIDSKDLLWLQEELEIVHSKSGYEDDAKDTSSLDYLRGQEISWENLRFKHDADRTLTSKLQRKIREDLRKNSTLRVNLYHVPGGGGTSVAKRIVWDFHEEYPCLVLRSSKNPKETSARLSHIAKLCDKPLLLLIDNGLISNRESDALYNELASSHLSIVIFSVLRTFEKNTSSRDFYLQDNLSSKEGDNFYHVLTQVKPNKKKQLNKALKENNITPFSLGFLTFEDQYLAIDNYVISRLKRLKTEEQKKIIIFLAIAYFYGQEKISAQWFNELLGIRSSKAVTSKHLNKLPDLSSIIIEDSGSWRIAHQIFAEKILCLLLPNMIENIQPSTLQTEEWKQHLPNFAKEFAKFCHAELPLLCEATKSLIYKVFYNRENSEIIGTESAGNNSFAKLIEDISSDEGKLGVLRYLADLYNEEAHVWAHLGRFYSVVMKRFDDAIISIDKALKINTQDFLIHHMKGMAIRSKAYELLENKGELAKIVEFANQAGNSFEEARNINQENEYGYISEVQMIIRVLNYVGSLSEGKPISMITRNDASPWLRESLERAFDLLNQVRQNRRGDRSSKYEETCQADLDTLCDKSDDAIDRWNNLLSRRELNSSDLSSVRRSLVWAYLHPVKRNWAMLEQKKVQRIADLLKENLKSDYGNDKNLRLWLQAIRYLDRSPNLEDVIEQVVFWKQTNNSIESIFYLYILHCLKAFEDSVLDADKAMQLIKECQERSRFKRKNEFSIEWLGRGKGFKQLLHIGKLGKWNRDERIWDDPSQLARMKGIISSIDGPTAGHIELTMGLNAFFVPAQSNHSKGKDENREVECYIGFSYLGLRAWNVKNVLTNIKP